MVIRLAGEKFKREAGRFRARSMSRFVRRSEGDDRINSLTLQSLAVELSFTAGRREVAFREGEKGVGILRRALLGGTDECVRPYVVCAAFEIQTDKMLAFQSITSNSSKPRIGRLQRAVDHGIHRFAEAFVLKAHALGKRAEQLNIGPAFADRIHRLIGNLQVIVAVSGLPLFVLEKSGGGQDDVGVVGSVGEELLVDNGEKVGAL